MIQIMANVTIEELPRFLGVFGTAGADARRRHGCQRSQIFAVDGEPNRVTVIFDWASREAFDGFLADTTVRATMQSSGTVGRPEFTFIRRIADLPG
jgi:quinol monooxygenase YgiN